MFPDRRCGFLNPVTHFQPIDHPNLFSLTSIEVLPLYFFTWHSSYKSPSSPWSHNLNWNDHQTSSILVHSSIIAVRSKKPDWIVLTCYENQNEQDQSYGQVPLCRKCAWNRPSRVFVFIRDWIGAGKLFNTAFLSIR